MSAGNSSYDRDVWEGRKPLTAPAPAAELVADLALLDVGWSAWSSRRRDEHGQKRGGVICGIDRFVDRDTGEVAWRFRTRFPAGDPLGWLVLEGHEVELPDGVEPLKRPRVWLVIRRICEALRPKHSAGGRTFSATESAAFEDAFTLYRVVR